MGRAQECVDAFLEPEQLVPQHVAETGADEDRNADECDAIRPGKGVAPGVAATVVARRKSGKDEHERKHARVKRRMIRREERFDGNVAVRPRIEK